MKANSYFGERLRQFRKRRGLSQLELAMDAGSTARYVSFIETGRSRPGRNVVLRLSSALNLSLRESNVLLESVGLGPEYGESSLDNELSLPVRRVVEKVLEKHNPYPAWLIGPGLRFLGSNKAAEKVFPGLVGLEPEAIVDLFCAPVKGKDESERQKNVRQMISALKHEIFHYPHPDLPGLLERVASYATDSIAEVEALETPVVFGSLPIGAQVARTVSTVMRFDKATDVTVSEVRIELVFPANDESERIMTDYYNS